MTNQAAETPTAAPEARHPVDIVDEMVADLAAAALPADTEDGEDKEDGEEGEDKEDEEDGEDGEGKEDEEDSEDEEDGEDKEDEEDGEDEDAKPETRGAKKRRLVREKIEAAQQEAKKATEELERTTKDVIEMQDLVRRAHKSAGDADAERQLAQEERDFWRNAAESAGVDKASAQWADLHFRQRLELLQYKNQEKATTQQTGNQRQAQVQAQAQTLITELKAGAAKYGVDEQTLARHYGVSVQMRSGKSFDELAQELAGKRPATKREKTKRSKNKNSKRAPVAIDAKGGGAAAFGTDRDGMLAWFEAQAGG